MLAVVCGGLAFAAFRHTPDHVSDFDQLWFGARALWQGRDPYSVVGPGRELDFPWPLYYPVPALLVVMPLIALPLFVARATFVAVSAGLLAYGITRDGWRPLLLFASAAYIVALTQVQFAPLFVAALFLPLVGVLLVAKPNLGLCIIGSSLSRSLILASILGGVVLVAASYVVMPTWFDSWRTALAEAPYYKPYLLRPGGILLLAAIVRWRRPEARLLVAMAIIPLNATLYDALPLFVIPATINEAALLALASHGAWHLALARRGDPSFLHAANANALTNLLLLYLPALVMILRRPNVGAVPIVDRARCVLPSGEIERANCTRRAAGCECAVSGEPALPDPRQSAAAMDRRRLGWMGFGLLAALNLAWLYRDARSPSTEPVDAAAYAACRAVVRRERADCSAHTVSDGRPCSCVASRCPRGCARVLRAERWRATDTLSVRAHEWWCRRVVGRQRGGRTMTAELTELAVVSPVYDDWDAVRLLLPQLDVVLASAGARARVVLVDDGSTQRVPPDLVSDRLTAIHEVRVLHLRRNLGHQRALAVGLAYVNEQVKCDAVVVMDADGEDDPPDVARLVQQLRERGGESIVFARRARRSEGLVFTSLYKLFRVLHRLLTGIPVQVGNFSVIPFPLLGRLVAASDLWNHYAAAVFQSRVPYSMIPTARARRLSGTSKMNLVALVIHGLSAIAVFADRVGVRILLASIGTLVAIVIVIAIAVIHSLWAHVGMSRWIVGGALIGFVLALQTAAAASLFVLQVLFSRGASTFIPARDYAVFLQSDQLIWRHADSNV